MARSMMSDDLVDLMVEEYSKDPSITSVCKRLGLDKSTVFGWLNKGRKGDPRYVELARQFDAIQAETESYLIGVMNDVITAKKKWEDSERASAAHAKNALTAAMWLLEKKFPNKYGPRVSIQHENVDNMNLSRLTDAEILHLEKLHKKLYAPAVLTEGEEIESETDNTSEQDD